MLKVENEKLPAHRTLLAESSVVFEAIFQARYFHLYMLPYSCMWSFMPHTRSCANVHLLSELPLEQAT